MKTLNERKAFEEILKKRTRRESCSNLSVGVEHREVADDDWNRKCDSENTGQGTQSAYKHPWKGFWRHVAVTDGRHGD